jgi:hypothetical protein
MMMRSIENTIYFASVNYALRFQESATCVIGPSGECQGYLPYGREGVLVHDIKLDEATGLLAARKLMGHIDVLIPPKLHAGITQKVEDPRPRCGMEGRERTITQQWSSRRLRIAKFGDDQMAGCRGC